MKGKKINTFSKQVAYNLETLGGIHKKNGTQSENSLLKNCEKLYFLSLKNWGSLYQKSSN